MLSTEGQKILIYKLSRASFDKTLHVSSWRKSVPSQSWLTLLTPPSTTGLKKARSWPGNGVYCSLMSPVYMESSFRRTFFNMQLSLMLLCRLLNKAPTANNVGAESRRCSSLKRWKNSFRSCCDREEWNIRKLSLYCDLGLLSFWWPMQEFQVFRLGETPGRQICWM